SPKNAHGFFNGRSIVRCKFAANQEQGATGGVRDGIGADPQGTARVRGVAACLRSRSSIGKRNGVASAGGGLKQWPTPRALPHASKKRSMSTRSESRPDALDPIF